MTKMKVWEPLKLLLFNFELSSRHPGSNQAFKNYLHSFSKSITLNVNMETMEDCVSWPWLLWYTPNKNRHSLASNDVPQDNNKYHTACVGKIDKDDHKASHHWWGGSRIAGSESGSTKTAVLASTLSIVLSSACFWQPLVQCRDNFIDISCRISNWSVIHNLPQLKSPNAHRTEITSIEVETVHTWLSHKYEQTTNEFPFTLSSHTKWKSNSKPLVKFILTSSTYKDNSLILFFCKIWLLKIVSIAMRKKSSKTSTTHLGHLVAPNGADT